ncbi:hypothetical protein HK105_204503 [Polyrhizophydium stewartii]|uniref:Molybdopterin synthase sulfur carrier subunit n=1 Tax=Polyrhizophydium stewartii TaxID=2732419 RepID=A0ABR4N9F0_9FUNG|nr:hypothetical protein HK105_003319 [Polyrhizophydium stewartii]
MAGVGDREDVPEPQPPNGAITVLYFASGRELAGVASEQLPLAGTGASVPEVLAVLTARHPALARIAPSCMLAVNMQMVAASGIGADGAAVLVRPGDEVALIPPVSGG